ncbi:MAG: hypothetical protein JWR26_4573 [Pedosphaera sp.]|nr:hypothetical protein [Pedosphaera sp.]
MTVSWTEAGFGRRRIRLTRRGKSHTGMEVNRNLNTGLLLLNALLLSSVAAGS